MLTLTYGASYPADGRVCKRHLDDLFRRMRYHYKSARLPTFSAFWFLEFQQRGAPHFHVFLTTPLEDGVKWLSETWADIIDPDNSVPTLKQSATRIEWLRAGNFGAAAYARKYAQKMEQKQVPEGFLAPGRFWGVYGCRKCSSAAIVFPFTAKGENLRKRFVIDLKEIAKGSKRLGEASIILRTGAKDAVKSCFFRYGMLLEASEKFAVQLYEYPTRDIE